MMRPQTAATLALLASLAGCNGGLFDCSGSQAPRMQADQQRPFGGDRALDAPRTEAKPAKPVFDRARIVFPEIDPGGRQEATVQLRNDGDQALDVALVRPADPAFDIAGSCLERRTIDGKAACTITVRFQPLAPGSFAATLGIDNFPDTVALTGSGRAPPKPVVPTGPSPAEIARQRLLGSIVAAPIAPARPPAYERRTYQADWTDKGWSRDTASLPVPGLDKVVLRHTPIAATIVESLNTEMGCPVSAVISQDIWGYKIGKKPLIPVGSRAEGQCSRVGNDAQTRVAIIWDRIVTPPADGRVINIAAPTLDQMGRAGVPGNKESFFWERYGKALLLTLVNVGATYGVAKESGNQTQTFTSGPLGTSSTVTLTPLQQALGQAQTSLQGITQDILNESLDYKARFEIPAGTAVVLYPQRDIWFDDARIVIADPAERLRAEREAAAPLSPLPAPSGGAAANGRVNDVQNNLEGAQYESRNPSRRQPIQLNRPPVYMTPSYGPSYAPSATPAPAQPSSNRTLEGDAGTAPQMQPQ
jgi:hypothetical protein